MLGLFIGIGTFAGKGGGVTPVYSVDLPQKLIITPDTFVEEMDATTGWTKTASASLIANTSEVHSGAASLRLTAAIGADAFMYRYITWNLTASQSRKIKLRIFTHSEIATTIAGVTIQFCESDAMSKCFLYDIPLSYLVQNKWSMPLDFSESPSWMKWTASGEPSWSNINFVFINVYGIAGGVSQLSFDLLTAGEDPKPAVIIDFDDTMASTFLLAYPLIKAKKMVATAFVVSDIIGNADRLSTSNLQEMYANGWDIGNHTKTHGNLNLLTQQQVVDELTNCKNVLDGLGLTRGSSNVAYPGGNYNNTVLAAMTSFGAHTGRTALNYRNCLDIHYPYLLNTYIVANTTTLAAVKAKIDGDILTGLGPTIITFHNLVTSNAIQSTDWLSSQFSDLLDYIESIGLQTLTIDEYYRLNSGSITVHHK